jgi:hypothetical protein
MVAIQNPYRGSGGGATSAYNLGNIGATVTMQSATTYGVQYGVLTASPVITLPAPVAGAQLVLMLTQNGTGGWTPSFSGTTSFPAGAVNWVQAASGVSVVSMFCPDGVTWEILPATSDVAMFTALGVTIDGIPGANGASLRFAGTSAGAPVSGTFQVNDVVLDTTNNLWLLCTSAPLTFTTLGGGGGGSPDGGGGPTTAGLGAGLQTMSLAACSSSSGGLSDQRAVFMLVTAPVTTTVTKLGIILDGAGTTPDGAGINGLGLFTESGTLMSHTGDMTTAFEGTGVAEGTLAVSQNIVAGTNYYLAIVTAFSGSQPAVFCNAPSANYPLAVNSHDITFFESSYTAWANVTPSGGSVNGHWFYIYAR